MKNLPPELNRIDEIKHTIYADEIIIWTPTSSQGKIKEMLQAAAKRTQEYGTWAALVLFAEKRAGTGQQAVRT